MFSRKIYVYFGFSMMVCLFFFNKFSLLGVRTKQIHYTQQEIISKGKIIIVHSHSEIQPNRLKPVQHLLVQTSYSFGTYSFRSCQTALYKFKFEIIYSLLRTLQANQNSIILPLH
ncbi:hypothetical protein Hanom_Chr06g00509751 [Helianthus anomalus]